MSLICASRVTNFFLNIRATFLVPRSSSVPRRSTSIYGTAGADARLIRIGPTAARRRWYSRWPQVKTRKKITLRIFGGPFLAPSKLDSQRVIIMLNDQQVASWTLTSAEPRQQVIELPVGALRDKNTLMFILPDAASPRSLGVSQDFRLLGFNVQWIEID